MDGVSIAASIVGIAGAGVQVSIKLVTLATQISTASDRVSAIGNDISLTSGVLHQLGELMTQKSTGDGVSIFSQGGLESTKASAAMCERIFHQVEREARKASEQLRDCKQGRFTGGKIKLSRAEKAKWPFLQPSVDTMRADLREAKGTLMLMLQVTTLALSKRMADLNEATSSSMSEQRDFVRAIVALQQQQQQQEHGPRLELRGKNPDGILPSQQVVSGVTSPRRSSAADRNPSVDVVQLTENPPMPVNASQPRASPAHPRASVYEPTSFPTATSIGQDMIVNFSTLSSILPGQDRSGEMSISSVPRGSFGASNAPSHTMDSVNNYQMYDGFSSVGTSARSISDRPGDGISAQNIDTELTLFLLKPVVKDFFDKVELSWSVQNTRMQPQAIRKQMADHEQEGMPSVLEMLHNLHAYEQAMVDLEISKYPEGSVLSLKRTKTDIQHRDMTFKAIPGLQFVVQHVIRSYACQEEQLANTLAQAPVITDPALHSALHIDLQQAQVAPHQQLQQMMQMAPQQQNLAAPPQQREGQWEEQQWDQQPRPLRRSKRTLNPRRSSPSFTQDDALAQYTIHHSTAGLPQPPATDPPMLQPQQQPQSYFTQDDPSAPHYTQAPYSFGPAPPPQQQLLAPQPQPPPPPPARQASLHRPRKRKAPVPARQASLPPSRKRKAPGSAPLVAMPPISSPRGPSTSIREQVLAFQHPPQSQQDDAGEAVSGVARRSAIGFLKKRKQKQDVVALPSSESKSEKEYEASDASDFDGSEGDDVDVDAIVKELLKKYTTLFD